MTEQTTNVTEPVTTPDPVPAPQPQVPPPSSQQPTDVFDPSDGKPWRTKYYGQKGAYEQLKNEVASKEGALSEQVKQLQQSLQISEAEVNRLKLANSELQGKADAIPQLQNEFQTLKEEAATAERMKVLLDYPEVLGIRIEETVQEEGQEPTTVQVNPILNLVANSNLEGNALRKEISRLASFYGKPQEAPPDDKPKGPPVAPSPATPSEETAEFWRLKAVEISTQMNSEGMSKELMDAHSEAWRKYAELSVRG